MKRILAAFVLLTTGAWASAQINGQGGVYVNGVLQGSGASSYSYLFSGGISVLAPTSDATPDPLLLKSGNAWPGATTNTTGANVILTGGIGRRIYTIVDYSGLGASTVTVTVNGVATVLTEPTHWSAATSNVATTASLAAAVNAVSGVTASASGTDVRIVPDVGTYRLVIAKSAADSKITATSGTDGDPIVGGVLRFINPNDGSISEGGLINSGGNINANTSFFGALRFTSAGYEVWEYNVGFDVGSNFHITWGPNAVHGSPDVGMKRGGVSRLIVSDGSTGFGSVGMDANTSQWADTVTLSDGAKTAVVDIAIADGEFIGGTLSYMVTATDATDHQGLTGIVGFSGVRKNGTPDTYHLTIAESASPVLAESSGASTLTDTWAIDAGTNVATISVTADSSLTTPTMTVRYQLTLNAPAAVTKK